MRDEKEIEQDIRDLEEAIARSELVIERLDGEAREHMRRYTSAANGMHEARTHKHHMEQRLSALLLEKSVQKKALDLARKTQKAQA
jgi:hypothetical protein